MHKLLCLNLANLYLILQALPNFTMLLLPCNAFISFILIFAGSYSCVGAEFVFRRNINYYIMGIFIPSIIIVVLSWMAFWIDKSSTPGRVSLSLITILTMQNQVRGNKTVCFIIHYRHKNSLTL